MIADPLFPQIQLIINGTDLTVEAKYLQGFRFRSILGTESSQGVGGYEFDVMLTDPSFEEIEDAIFSSTDGSNSMAIRWGYFGDDPDLSTELMPGSLTQIAPCFGIPFSYTISAIAAGAALSLQDVEPRHYSGRISDVVLQIADELNLEPNVTTTNDDFNTLTPVTEAKNWLTGGMDRLQFIKRILIPQAESTNPQHGHYYVSVGAHPDGTPVPNGKKGWLNFQPIDIVFSTLSLDDTSEIPTFKYLFGSDDSTIRFTPTVSPIGVGGIGTDGLMVGKLDPQSKKFVPVSLFSGSPDVAEISRADLPIDVPPPSADQGTSETTDPQGATHVDQKSAQGVLSIPHFDPNERDSIARNKWKELFKLFSTAELELVGRPDRDVVQLRAGMLVRILVMLPSGKIHYSSGIYTIQECTHEINSTYTVRCVLFGKLPLNPNP
jgi:hypothetical protein